VDPAVGACDALLSADSIATVTGAQVTASSAGMTSRYPDFPESPTCAWTLSDGSSIGIQTFVESSGPVPSDIEKALAFGGSKVTSLPQPAVSVIYDGEGQLIAGRVGPLLTESVIFTARSADGTTDDLDLLERLALASAAQPVVTPAPDPRCVSHLDAPIMSTQQYEAPSDADDSRTDLHCGYDLEDGSRVALDLAWVDEDGVPDCCSKVKGLGKGAWAQQSGSGKKAPWEIQWVLTKGDPARVATLRNGAGGTSILSKAQLIALAKTVTVDEAAPASASPGPVVSIPPEAAALVGTWAFPGGDGSLALPDGLTVSLTFGSDGTVIADFACTPPKKKAPLSWSGTYTADATTLDVTWRRRFKGDCKDQAAQAYAAPFSFFLGLMTSPGAWSVSGDTLTLTGTEGPLAGTPYEMPRSVP